MNVQHGENILSKSVQNLHPYMGGSNIESINDEKNIAFQEKKFNYLTLKTVIKIGSLSSNLSI